MDLMFWLPLVLVMILIGAKQVSLATWKYYLYMVAFTIMVQVVLLLPYFYFPFRPFDYRNANASAKLGMSVGRLLGIRYELSGVEQLTKSGGIVLINHQSFLDLIVLSYLWLHLGPAAVIAKKEIMYLPPIGISIWSYGSIFIDRSNKAAARRSIERASEAIHRDGKKLIFFPEGTRSIGDTLLPFRNGAFVSAFDNKCPVFPVVVSKFTFMDHIRKRFTPGTGLINILPPVNSQDFSNNKELRDHCQVAMQKEYDRLNALTEKRE